MDTSLNDKKAVHKIGSRIQKLYVDFPEQNGSRQVNWAKAIAGLRPKEEKLFPKK